MPSSHESQCNSKWIFPLPTSSDYPSMRENKSHQFSRGKPHWFLLLVLTAAVFVDLRSSNAAPGPELVSPADPNQASATAGALMIPQVNQRAFSADGRYVVFQSSSENLIAGLTEDKVTANIFLHDRVTN